MYGGQKMTPWTRFSPSSFLWVLEIELESADLHGSASLLSHLTTQDARF